MASKLSGIELTRYDDLFKTDAEREADRQERIQIVPAAEVFPYSRQPYTIDRPTPDLVRLMDSIEHIGIAEPLIVNGILSHRTDIEKRVGELMDTVGIARRLAYAYPHELDGGRRQRVGIARALSVKPKFIVCDEPVSSLDVSIQAQVLNLMMDFQDEFGLTYMFITHDLSVVKHISDEIMVMYLGQCVERASSKELFANPMHPYTKALLSAVPIPSLAKRGKPRDILSGEVVSPIDPVPGCRFAARCKYATEKCKDPVQFQQVSEGHFLACKRFEE